MTETFSKSNNTPPGSEKSGDPVLSVRGLSAGFSTDEGRFKVVDDVNFDIFEGESVGLVGESGCGKSVTALSILRLIPSPPGFIDAQRISFNGVNLMDLPPADLRRVRGRDISMIFQEPLSALSPLHRVGRQMVETLKLHRKINRAAARRIAESWLRKVGIPDPGERMNAYPHQLSGGMQQRVMIAMALMLSPGLVIADEPTTALDVTTQAQVFELIKEMKQRRTALLLITHDMGVVWEMCDRIMIMYASRIVESGPKAEIFDRPRHPYTIGLLNAIPRLTARKTRLADIPGQVPSPLEYPKGCHFIRRCDYAGRRCEVEKPPLYDCGNTQKAACFLMGPGTDGRGDMKRKTGDLNLTVHNQEV
jgi:oligopeptide/dipeptide ABC transporter ATP-binding protein